MSRSQAEMEAVVTRALESATRAGNEYTFRFFQSLEYWR